MERKASETHHWPIFGAIVVVTALVVAGITALLVNIIQRKTEAKEPYVST